MASSFLDRYRSGDRVRVWEDLVALGPGVRENRLTRQDAEAVAAETMMRAAANVTTLRHKLDSLGYWFGWPSDHPEAWGQPRSLEIAPPIHQEAAVDPQLAALHQRMATAEGAALRLLENVRAGQPIELQRGREAAQATEAPRVLRLLDNASAPEPLLPSSILRRASPQTERDAKKIEKIVGGPLPLSLQAWWTQFEQVNFAGVHDRLNPLHGHATPDPLVIFSPSDSLAELEMWEGDEGDPVLLALSPDGLHKSHSSGGDLYGMRVPQPAADGGFLHWERPLYFVQYLREVFAWGGFPGWAREPERPERELSFLREGLLDI